MDDLKEELLRLLDEIRDKVDEASSCQEEFHQRIAKLRHSLFEVQENLQNIDHMLDEVEVML